MLSMPFQRLYDGAFEVARYFFFFHILHRVGLGTSSFRSSESWLVSDDEVGLLGLSRNVHRQSWQSSPSLEHSDNQALSSSNPSFSSGDVKAVEIVDEDGQHRVATTINEELMEYLNDMLNKNARRHAKERAVASLEDKLDKIDDLARGAFEAGENDGPGTILRKSKDCMSRLYDRIHLYQTQIKALEGSSGSDQRKIACILEVALKAGEVLEQPVVREESTLSDDGDLDMLLRGETFQETELTADEKLVEAEQQKKQEILTTAWDMVGSITQKLCNAKMSLENKYEYEYREQEVFKANLENGRAQETRSEFDVRMLQYGMYWTGQLLDAESELSEVKADLFAQGICTNGLSQPTFVDEMEPESPFGSTENLPSGLNPDQVDAYDFDGPMDDSDRSRIDDWVDGIDQSENPEFWNTDAHKAVKEDEWQAYEPQIHDSFSMVDETSVGQQIGQWQVLCEEQRQQWRSDFPIGNPRETYGHSFKRCMSF